MPAGEVVTGISRIGNYIGLKADELAIWLPLVFLSPTRHDHFLQPGVIHNLVNRQRGITCGPKLMPHTPGLGEGAPACAPVPTSHCWERTERVRNADHPDRHHYPTTDGRCERKEHGPPPTRDPLDLDARWFIVERRCCYPQESPKLRPVVRDKTDYEAGVTYHRHGESRLGSCHLDRMTTSGT